MVRRPACIARFPSHFESALLQSRQVRPSLPQGGSSQTAGATQRVADSRYSPSEYEDLSTLAAQKGLDLDDVLDRFAGLSTFYDKLDTLTTRDGIVGAVWSDTGHGVVYVQDPDAPRVAETLGDDVEIVRSTAPDESAQLKLTETIAGAFEEVAGGVEIQYEFRDNSLTITSTDSERRQDTYVLALKTAKVESARLGVSLREADTENHAQPAYRGGYVYSTCTGGFVVQSGGVYGISTAHHCTSKPSTYDGATTGTTTAYSTRDVRWTRITTGTPSPTIRDSATTHRTITSSGNPVVGAASCKYGKTTGYGCDIVESSGYCANYPGWPEFCGLYKTVDDIIEGGDSGGPWFFGNKAHGITSGQSSNQYSLFSGIGSLSLLGVTVVTG
jgi:hypothetical protein